VERGYDEFAEIYDRIFGPDAAEETWGWIQGCLIPRLAPGARVVDLCCGTGEMAARLAERGFRVTGLDGSARMLEIARLRAPGARFFRTAFDAWALDRRVDAVLCCYNSLPHATSLNELRRVFGCVQAALRPGGWFGFDLFSDGAYRAHWRGEYVRSRGGMQCRVRAGYDRRSRMGWNEARWDGAGVRLTTRCHRERELRAAAAKAGLEVVAREDRGGRMFWLNTAGS